jgi:hypothetical protein
MQPTLPRFLVPDPGLARRAVGEVRRNLRRGIGLLREGVERAPLPRPVAAAAGEVLGHVDMIARHADAVASMVAHRFLAVAGVPVPDAQDEELATLIGTLNRALRRLDLPGYVNEAAVGAALGSTPSDLHESAASARLMIRLMEEGAVRLSSLAESPRLPVAVFAAVMMRGDDQSDDALASGVALAEAVSEEILAAGRDPAELERLFAEFRPHV